jgi:hypothetical protein
LIRLLVIPTQRQQMSVAQAFSMMRKYFSDNRQLSDPKKLAKEVLKFKKLKDRCGSFSLVNVNKMGKIIYVQALLL